MRVLRSIPAFVLLLGVAVLPARGARRVYLSSGDTLICDHIAAVGGVLRLYMTRGQDSYLDLSPADVLRVEQEPAAAKGQSAAGQPPAAAAAPLDVNRLLREAGAIHHIDPDLLASIVLEESGGNPRAVSRAGAVGLMQLMPATASDLRIGNVRRPAQNVAAGSTYLDALLMYYHDDVVKALAAYNAGPAVVDRYHGLPPYPETRRYVARVIHEYNRRKAMEWRRNPQPPGTAHGTAVASR
jgi:soluble lytic murein transglycosylase-like protein